MLTEKKMLDLPFTILPQQGPQRIFARMGTLEKKLNWNEAKQYSNVGVDFLIVPLNFNLKPFGENYELARFIVFYKSKTSGITMEIVELLSKKGESFKGKQAEIIAACVNNKLAQKNENISGVNADVFFYNDQYRRVGSYEIKNGGIQKTKNRLKISDKLENNSVTNLLTTNSSNCQFWYVVVDWYDSEGNFVYRDILYSFETGDCSGEGNNGNPNEEPGEPAGGGGDEDGQWEEGDVAKFADLDWTAYNIPASFGGGIVMSKDRFIGRKNPNRPERNRFINGGGHLGTHIYYNDYNGELHISIYGVNVNSPSQATAECGGNVDFTNGTPRVNFNSSKVVSFAELVWQ